MTGQCNRCREHFTADKLFEVPNVPVSNVWVCSDCLIKWEQAIVNPVTRAKAREDDEKWHRQRFADYKIRFEGVRTV